MNPTVSLTSTRRSERGEHARVGQHAGPREAIEEGRFAGVGVPGQRQSCQRNRYPAPAVQRSARAHAFQLKLDLLDAAGNPPTVGFELCLARSASSNPATQP